MSNKRKTPKHIKKPESWSLFFQNKLCQTVLAPNEQMEVFYSKFNPIAASALTKKEDDFKPTSWFDVVSGLAVGALTIDLPVTFLMMATTSVIYGESFNPTTTEFAISFTQEACKSIVISSLNFGLRNLLRKGEDGNLPGGLIGGAIDRHLRTQANSFLVLMGSVNAIAHEFFRPEIGKLSNSLPSFLGIFALIEGIDAGICSFAMNKNFNDTVKSIATSVLLGCYLATCINKLTIPYGEKIKKPLISMKDKVFDNFVYNTQPSKNMKETAASRH